MCTPGSGGVIHFNNNIKYVRMLKHSVHSCFRYNVMLKSVLGSDRWTCIILCIHNDIDVYIIGSKKGYIFLVQ